MGAGRRSIPIAGTTPPYRGEQSRSPEDAFPSRNASQGPSQPSRDVRPTMGRSGIDMGAGRSTRSF
jgi:hypothetical protein